MLYSVGSIIILKNIIFKNGDKCFDHSYKFGRPCLVISVIDDMMYFIPLSSDMNKNYDNDFKLNKKYCTKKSKINVSCIYCRYAYYHEEKCRLDDKDLLMVLKFIYNYQMEHHSDELFSEIKEDIEYNIESISKQLSNRKKLVYKL